jgi:predicted RNase H-like HicB family nuclease
MTEILFLVEEDIDGGYTARALDEAIFTQGETVDELKKMVRDAVLCHFDKNACPDHICLQFIKKHTRSLLIFVGHSLTFS